MNANLAKYCIVLRCIALRCLVWCGVVLCCVALRGVALRCVMLCCVVWCCVALCCVALPPVLTPALWLANDSTKISLQSCFFIRLENQSRRIKKLCVIEQVDGYCQGKQKLIPVQSCWYSTYSSQPYFSWQAEKSETLATHVSSTVYVESCHCSYIHEELSYWSSFLAFKKQETKSNEKNRYANQHRPTQNPSLR